MDLLFLQEAFREGGLDLKGQFTLGSNYTFLVKVQHEGQELDAVYKPQKGEQPLWDFPENTLSGREAAAYIVSQALGWKLVPYTIFRPDGPFGPGSLQLFIQYNPNYHYFNMKPADKEKLRPVVLFDHITNNADRKGSHVFFEKRTRHLFAIDHGLCFNAEDKHRTVIWDFAGQSIPAELLADMHKISQPSAQLLADLRVYLNEAELESLVMRTEILLKTAVFPDPPTDRRAFPYPPL